MTTARVFQSGNSQTIRLPREMRLDISEVEITRHGDLLILRPICLEATLSSAFDALAKSGKRFDPPLPPQHQHLHLHHQEQTRGRPGTVRRATSWRDGPECRHRGRVAARRLQKCACRAQSRRRAGLRLATGGSAFDSQAADTYGRLRAELEKAGQLIGPLNFQTAATAVAHSLTLVTRHTREFVRVPGLKVKDWTQ